MRHLFRIFAAFSLAWTAYSHQFHVDGTVLELDDSNIDSALAAFDVVFVDFYAPWCGHCKRLSPELDAAARALYNSEEPIVIAKVNADKYTNLARKYEIDGFPTLKLFIHGVPVDYQGPRKAELLVCYLKKFVAPDVAVLESDTAILNFIEDAGTYFPIFIVFGYNDSLIWNIAIKHKKKAWFSISKDFSEHIMDLYDFGKVPALVSVHPGHDESSVFYGPFEEELVEEFIKQNFLPLVLRINHESLTSLKNDDRKILLCIVEDETDEKAMELIRLLKAAASANRDLVFGYVGVKQWAEFAETFEASTKIKLPKMVVWDGNEEYISIIDSGGTSGEDLDVEITKFLEAYRQGRTVKKKMKGPSFIGFINSLIGIRTVYLLVFVVGVIMLIQAISKEEPPLRMDAQQQPDNAGTSEIRNEYKSLDKED